MKIAAAAALFFVSLSAHAGPLACEGWEILASGRGPKGNLELNVYPVKASFAPFGETLKNVISSEEVCGVPMVNNICRAVNQNPAAMRERRLECRHTGDEYAFVTADLIIDEAGREGRVRCNAPGKQRVIEFRNCEPKHGKY